MKKRRDFLKTFVAGTTLFPQLVLASRGKQGAQIKPVENKTLRIDNPYAHINWDRVKYVPSTSHVHIGSQSKLDKMYTEYGLRHIPISNYYPSVPYYPADKIRENQFAVQEFGVAYNPAGLQKGSNRVVPTTYLKGPLDWNKIIMDKEKGWYKDLPKEFQDKLPFKVGERVFKNIPSDLIISPNAEHHSFLNSSLHANAIGSMYASGNFDARNRFMTLDHGYSSGTGLKWEDAFSLMIDKLIFKDAGGITINHPTWSGLPFEQVENMLDFDERVLGIEVFNDTCFSNFGEPERGWALKLWDKLLSTRRRCLGFFVPDHTMGRGRNILLVPEFTEHACLKAYRQGAFFGALDGNGLHFTRIHLEKNTLSVSLSKRSSVRFVTNEGEAQKTNGDSVEFKIPVQQNGLPSVSYVRVEAIDDYSEQIFSQPIRFLNN